jgi:hypothetical protein
MGAGASTAASISDPFPVSPALARDLDKLSMVAARILSTPDIYDVENLGRPGTCGDYMVMLKKGIEKKLLPFVAKTRTGNQEIVYQNPRKAIDNIEDRKMICKSLVNTMLRTITIVVACLASIQVASTSREVVVTSQRGGGMNDVRDWLLAAGYLQPMAVAMAAAGTPMELTVDPTLRAKGISMKLTFRSATGNLTEAYLSTSVAAGSATPAMPPGSIKVQFLNPLPIPGTAKSMLPLRIVDDAGQPWLAGALYDNVFKSFYAPTEHVSLTATLEILFRRTQGWRADLIERRADTAQANEVFQAYRRTNNATFVFNTINTWLQTHVAGYNPAAVAAAPAAFPVAGAFPGFPGAPAAGFPAAGFPGFPLAPRPVTPLAPLGAPAWGARGAIPPTGLLPSGTQQYDIPIPSAKVINDSFKLFRELLPRQSSPAHVRAYTLAGRLNPDRTVDSAICQDPYWRESSLAKVYPWATLQFLCIKNWEKISPPTADNFESTWTDFTNQLNTIYNTPAGIRLDRRGTTSPSLLDQLTVKGYDKLPICGRALPFAPIQEGIARLQELYKAHVPKVWALLNELVVIVQVEDDAGVKRDVVRLNPNIVTGTTKTTEDYVNERHRAARELLADFYLQVERAYMDTIDRLT